MTEDTSSVEFEVVSLEPCRSGAVIAVAAVRLVFDGVEITTQGWCVRRLRGGFVEIAAPGYRCPRTDVWAAAVALPDELQNVIAERIGAMLKADATPALAA